MLRNSLGSWRLGNARCCLRTGYGVLSNVETFGDSLMLRRGVGCFWRKRKLMFDKSSGANCISVSAPLLEIVSVRWKFRFPSYLRFGPQPYRIIVMGQGTSQTRSFGVDKDKDCKEISVDEEIFKNSQYEDANDDNAIVNPGVNLEIDPVGQQEDPKLESSRGFGIDSLDLNPNVVEYMNATGVAPEELTRILDIKMETEIVIDESKDDSEDATSEPIEKAPIVEDELGEPPERPLPDDCCGQGCEPCVWDTYNDELRDYLARKKALEKGNDKQ